MLDTVFSGTYRTDAARRRAACCRISIRPRLQPGSIRPGTLIYDTNGHVGIVYQVDDAGRIYYMDAHPDFTITRSVYGAAVRPEPGAAGRRPEELAAAAAGGRAWRRRRAWSAGIWSRRATTRSRISRWSSISAPNRATAALVAITARRWASTNMSASRCRAGAADFNPVYELQATMRTLCNDLEDRRQAVDQAVANGIAAKLHPSAIPANIYPSATTATGKAMPRRRAMRGCGRLCRSSVSDLAEMIQHVGQPRSAHCL